MDHMVGLTIFLNQETALALAENASTPETEELRALLLEFGTHLRPSEVSARSPRPHARLSVRDEETARLLIPRLIKIKAVESVYESGE